MKYITQYIISGLIGSFIVSLMSLVHHSFIIKIPNTPESFIIPIFVGFASGMLIQYFKAKWENEAIEKEMAKLKTVRELTGAICHELNQPLMTISGHLEMLFDNLSENDIEYKNLIVIHEQTKRIVELTNKISKINDYVTKPYLSGEIVDIEQSYIPKSPP